MDAKQWLLTAKVQFIDIVSSTEDRSGTWVEKGGINPILLKLPSS